MCSFTRSHTSSGDHRVSHRSTSHRGWDPHVSRKAPGSSVREGKSRGATPSSATPLSTAFTSPAAPFPEMSRAWVTDWETAAYRGTPSI